MSEKSKRTFTLGKAMPCFRMQVDAPSSRDGRACASSKEAGQDACQRIARTGCRKANGAVFGNPFFPFKADDVRAGSLDGDNALDHVCGGPSGGERIGIYFFSRAAQELGHFS